MTEIAKKVILFSNDGYSKKHDSLLQNLINQKIRLFCVVGKDCVLWEEIMDEFFIAEGSERSFFLVTTSHPENTFDEVFEFAKAFKIEGINNEKIEVIQV